MKLAIIPPIAYLNSFSTDYHLVLAHLLQVSPVYFDYYLKRRRAGDFIIMDNGAAEQGSAINSDELYRLACQLKPHVIVCPDVLYDGQATVAATTAFLSQYGKLLTTAGTELLAVPQGHTAEEWFASYDIFNSDKQVTWLGISKYVAGAFIKRAEALKGIADTVHKKCHLLGMDEDPEAIFEEKSYPFIKSTDTAVPVKLGLQMLSMLDYFKRTKIKDNDYFFMPPRLDFQAYSKVLANVEVYKGCCV